MIANNRRVSRSERVSSQELRDLDDSMVATLSMNYHRIRKLLGKLRTMMTCLRVTNASFARELRVLLEEDDMAVTITAENDPVYPSSLQDAEKAENHSEFGVICAKRLNTALVFTDETNQVRPTIELIRSTTTGTTEELSTMIENSLEHSLIGNEPYLCRFVGEMVSKANLSIDIISRNREMNINALRFIPMPSAGGTSLGGLRYDGVNPVVMNGNQEYPIETTFNRTKSYPGYVHFKPVVTNLLRLNMNSNLYVAQLGCIAIGVSQIIGEYNAYAKKSYIGYLVEVPEGATKLVELSMYEDQFALSALNARVKVYDNLSDFNNISSNFIASSIGVQTMNLSISQSYLYVLLEITSVDNTTPCIGKIVARFA